MSETADRKQNLLVAVLTVGALAILMLIYVSPVWWVSLTAPNYPAEAFPDGVRIHFHMNGVFNGCRKVEKVEIQEEEALDCVHEMDTINHYVGMYPIAAGAPVERGFSQFLVAMVAVMLVGFMLPGSRLRLGVMVIGFAGIAGWMYLTFYVGNGIALQNEGYVSALVMALDQGGGDKDAADDIQPSGQALVDRLRRSLEESGVDVDMPAGDAMQESSDSAKQIQIENLRATYEKDKSVTEPWSGSGLQVMTWHYDKALGRYFNNRAEIEPMVATLRLASNIVFWAIIAAMLLLLWGARRNSGPLYWLLVLAPMALPLFFLVDYSAWLWWFGHNLNEMGAFTVKPFMPTVFGQGKVAQFATHSYPSIGFGLMLLFSLLLAASALVRRKQSRVS